MSWLYPRWLHLQEGVTVSVGWWFLYSARDVFSPRHGAPYWLVPVLVIEAEGFLLAAWFLTGGRYW